MTPLLRIPWLQVLALLAVLAPVPAAAQQRAQLERRVRERFAQMVMNRLGLDDDQTARLRGTIEEFRQERSVLAAESRSLRVRARNAVQQTGGGVLDDEAGAGFLAELRELAQREADLVVAEQEALGQVLTPGQLVVFYQMRDQMNQRIQQLRNNRGNGRLDGSRPSGPDPGTPVG